MPRLSYAWVPPDRVAARFSADKSRRFFGLRLLKRLDSAVEYGDPLVTFLVTRLRQYPVFRPTWTRADPSGLKTATKI